MNRVRNANQFSLEFRKTIDRYQEIFKPQIARLREEYATFPEEEGLVDESLEIHIRSYVINALLAALNWRIDTSPENDLPNLVPEAPVRSVSRGTIRFLDYLGIERQTDKPLLVIEVKRPSSNLPQDADRSRKMVKSIQKKMKFEGIDVISRRSNLLADLISSGLKGNALTGEWGSWLDDLRDYIRSVNKKAKRTPKRVVITNGKWFVLFLDPGDAFLEHGMCSSDKILVFERKEDILNLSHLIFQHLEHQKVLEQIPPLNPGELPFHVAGQNINRALHGIRLQYIEQKGIYDFSPVIKLAIVIFLRTQFGIWIRVEQPRNEYQIPHDANLIPKHLDEIRQRAEYLLETVKSTLSIPNSPPSLQTHYVDTEAFESLPGVCTSGTDQFLLVTSNRTHYLKRESPFSKCPYHDWVGCNHAGVASNRGAILNRSVKPRAFFISGEMYHCAHRDITEAKASQISAGNRPRCGARSGKDGDAFCEIWSFESHLCCRFCAFEEVCCETEVFQPIVNRSCSAPSSP